MDFTLPSNIATKRDIVKVLHEVENLAEERVQYEIRKEHGAKAALAEPSPQLHDLLSINSLSTQRPDLLKTKEFLQFLKERAPKVRIVFSSEPEQDVSRRIVEWFRHATGLPVLVYVGVQPTIAGGCLVFTPNHRYDFSLRKHLFESNDAFMRVMARAGMDRQSTAQSESAAQQQAEVTA